MNIVATLIHLQTLDHEIEEKTKRARQVDEMLANDPTVAAARAVLEVEQKKFTKLRATNQDRELEAKSLDAKIKELNDRLYSGRVTNPKELDGYSKDLDMHKRNRSAMDDKLLELMDSIEQAQKRVDAQASTLKQVESKRAGDLDQLTHESATITARLVELSVEREKTRAALNADTLQIYDRLMQTKTGRAITSLKHNACGACGVSIPTGLINRVRSGDELLFCSSCGRILAP